ncbi:hypothetical protein RRG08_045830 [Elysia crispata]|uniref:Uncharacterized protein n=1 Tax=Elysia crispata TaxID=231223 RepID=A0AAE1E8S0_9GAST|nr:hypothetical protein RRG08_045830 [Elysia crispata]
MLLIAVDTSYVSGISHSATTPYDEIDKSAWTGPLEVRAPRARQGRRDPSGTGEEVTLTKGKVGSSVYHCILYTATQESQIVKSIEW